MSLIDAEQVTLPGLTRAQKLKSIKGCCDNITRIRDRTRRGRFPLRDRPKAARDLVAWRKYAKELFASLPEVGSPGCCECVFTFESIRIK